MGLFDKKYCDICGDKIGLFGNRKVEDGNICKNCARKLSPWFDDRRHTDLAGIKEQLAYREQNKNAVENFHLSRELGKDMRVLLDESAGNFIVTDKKHWEDENPDVIHISDVTNCNMDISESKSEQYYQNNEGERESYNPPRYKYKYRFKIDIQLRHPFIDEISFQLNELPVEMDYQGSTLFGLMGPNPETDYEYRRYQDIGNQIVEILTDSRFRSVDTVTPGDYRNMETPVSAAPDGSEAPRIASSFCPYCGKKTKPDSRFCENCGAKLKD